MTEPNNSPEIAKIGQEYAQRRAASIVYETRLHAEKLVLADRILCWSKNFSQTPAFAEFSGARRSPDFRAYPIDVFGGGGWVHERPAREEHGAWSWCGLTPEGSLTYQAGYKGFAIVCSATLTTPAEIADLLTHAYLAKFSDEINNDKIIERIKRYNTRK